MGEGEDERKRGGTEWRKRRIRERREKKGGSMEEEKRERDE